MSKDGFGLDADTFHAVDNDQGTICDTQSRDDLREEVDVAQGVDLCIVVRDEYGDCRKNQISPVTAPRRWWLSNSVDYRER